MHVLRDYCTEGNCLASEFCPAESIVQKSFLDYTRVDYGPNIVADDNAYLLSTWEAKEPCTVHNGQTVVPENPENPDEEGSILDPDNPDYDPSGGFGDENMKPEEGDGGSTEQTPPEEGSTGEDDWWVLIN